jgi:hypothetical protein
MVPVWSQVGHNPSAAPFGARRIAAIEYQRPGTLGRLLLPALAPRPVLPAAEGEAARLEYKHDRDGAVSAPENCPVVSPL